MSTCKNKAGFYVWTTADIPLKLKFREGTGNPLEGWSHIMVSIAQMARPLVELTETDLGIDTEASLINVHLTQEQTGRFQKGEAAIQVNVCYDNSDRDASAKGFLEVKDNLHKQVMP